VSEKLLESLITAIVGILGAVLVPLIQPAIPKTTKTPIWIFVLAGFLVGLLVALLLVTPLVSAGICPKVEYLSANPQTVPVGGTSSITVIAYDPGSSAPVYIWSAERGSVPTGSVARQTVEYRAPDVAGPDTVTVIARNSICAKSDSTSIQVVEEP
jgi:hypothetical protein